MQPKSLVKRVHGHRLAELEEMIERELQLGGLQIADTLLGGMTNINLLCDSEEAKFVLKLPGLRMSVGENPFANEYAICQHFAVEGLCPRPVSLGRLNDEDATPYMVYHYESGSVHWSLESMSVHELTLLRAALEKLSRAAPPDVRTYSKPSDFLNRRRDRMESVRATTRVETPRIKKLSGTVDGLFVALRDQVYSELPWSGTLMHGDLRPSNIVFQKNRAVLLDWGECSYGDALLDVAYLMTEPQGEQAEHIPLIGGEEEQSIVESMKVLSLMAAIAWTAERLIRIELGHIEENLASSEIVRSMSAYFEEKVGLLRKRL
ncbi:MAG: aminoglycoside phosphotransferase family protein [Candidatus Thorarchaeota archaeon]